MAKAGEYSRLIAGKKVKALFSESGELAYVEVDGSVFEGVGDFAPVPVWRLRRLRLGEIPDGVLIQPVEGIDGNVIYSIGLGRRASFEAKIGKGYAVLEMSEWPQDWDRAIGFYAYLNSMVGLLEDLERMNAIQDLEVDFTDELFTVSFTIRLGEELTVLKALKIVKRFISTLEQEAEYRAAGLALREAKRIVAQRRGKRGQASFHSKVARILQEAGSR